jgi:hypothetical protein
MYSVYGTHIFQMRSFTLLDTSVALVFMKPYKAKWLIYVPLALILDLNKLFSPLTQCIYVLRIVLALNNNYFHSVKRLVFLMDIQSVSCQVRTGILYDMLVNFRFQNVS